ncbi:MAG: Rieske (2Fe-2S) protein [Pseudorhodoplanes sp.]|nr:Rieske (2Fe-2S) protein [Pseudorhodoplanes sp.]
MPARWIHACGLEAFDRRTIVAVNLLGQDVILIRDADRFFAAERACPHEGADLAHGRCSGGSLFCPRHSAWFDLQDGAVSPGWSFPALRIYPVRVIGDGLWIDLSDVAP